MNASTFNRLHALRMANDAAGFDMAELAPRFDRLAKRHENGSAPRAVVVHQLFQTPPDLAARLVALLFGDGSWEMGVGPLRILEPSAGLGRLLDALTSAICHLPSPAEIVAVEVAADCARELFTQDRPGVTILQRDFLTLSPDDPALNQSPLASSPSPGFDFIAMNPPFTMRADIRHILHARQFLKPGGRLAALCLDTPERAAKLKHLCAEWIAIPAGTFKQEGTRVPTVLLLMQN